MPRLRRPDPHRVEPDRDEHKNTDNRGAAGNMWNLVIAAGAIAALVIAALCAIEQCDPQREARRTARRRRDV